MGYQDYIHNKYVHSSQSPEVENLKNMIIYVTSCVDTMTETSRILHISFVLSMLHKITCKILFILPKNTRELIILILVLGQKFALLELKAVISGILRKYVLVAVDKPSDKVLLQEMVLRPKGGIKIKLLSRK